MPNGVICGGAVDGSNQLGAIVACHAMTARPDGAGSAAPTQIAPSTVVAADSKKEIARYDGNHLMSAPLPSAEHGSKTTDVSRGPMLHVVSGQAQDSRQHRS